MNFKQSLLEDKVGSLMMRQPAEVQANQSLQETIREMQKRELGCAVIVDEVGKPTGIFTESCLVKVLVQGSSLNDTKVCDVMDHHFLLLHSDEPVSRAWNAIVHEGIRFVCVIDDTGGLVGLTGQRGMADYVSECFPMQVMVQRLGETPWSNKREGA